MILYLLKATTCLAIFLVFYKLFLEQENMHVFKRFYLIASILIAFIIPSILFTEYIYIEPQPYSENLTSAYSFEEFSPISQPENKNYITTILWVIYATGLLVFGFKFFQNLFKIRIRIRKSPKIKKQDITHVLLKEKLVPHTFFNFIFLNKQKFEAKEIPEEVLLHEKTHASQKHSIDVLFIELLQVLFWFNPLIYIFKTYIKLNHEFLADQGVMQEGVERIRYQKILLSFSSNDVYQQTALTNAINYSSIKKRFTVMKKHTSKKAVWLRSLLVLPLFALLLYSFSETQVLEVQKQNQNDTIREKNQKELEAINHLETDYDLEAQQKSDSTHYIIKAIAPTQSDFEKWKNPNEYALWIHGKHVNNAALNSYKSSDFAHYFSSFVYNNVRSERFPQPYQVNLYTPNEFKKQFTVNDREITILINKNSQLLVQNELIKLADLKDYLSTLNTDLTKQERSEKIRAFIKAPKSVMETALKVNNILTEYGCTTINIVEPTFKQNGASKSQLSEYNTLAEKYNAQPINQRIIKKSELEKLESIYRLMTVEQKQNAQPFPECPPQPKSNQDGATEAQILEYNTLARKYNTMDPNNMRIQKSEIDRMEYIYSIMTKKQKKDAEVYPEIPPIPEPPMPPLPPMPNRLLEHEKALNKQEKKLVLQEKALMEQEKELRLQESKLIEQEKIIATLPTPPLPPTPKSPLDHVIEMAKKGALFYYEDKEISSDKAIEILKKNNDLNIDTRNSKGKNPVVRISKEPISIEN